MQGRNCPNCGAALESNICKCPYCGTSYFDISAINIDDGEPFYLKLKMRDPCGKETIIVTAFVRADPNLSITAEQDTLYCQIGNGYKAFATPTQYHFNMNFHSVQRVYCDDKKSITFERIKE